ncbi:MAG: BspA family leucine-rich repeat surface protein [Clostridia bacterium]|nr:BspA family leucine-rich repeat surface protein [Clostridia bacterium]
MYKKYIIILILSLLFLMNNNQTYAKYVFNETLNVARLNTGGNYYLITYTEKGYSNQKIEKVYKGDNHDSDGNILKHWIIDKRTTLETIKIEDNSGDIRDCSYLFGGSNEILVCVFLKKIDLTGFNMENVTNMKFMFYDCVSLVDLNVSNLKTSKVTDMSYMFKNCQSLQIIDLRSFDTHNVTNMDAMFGNCRVAKEIKVSSRWTTEKATTKNMFVDCGVSSVSFNS